MFLDNYVLGTRIIDNILQLYFVDIDFIVHKQIDKIQENNKQHYFEFLFRETLPTINFWLIFHFSFSCFSKQPLRPSEEKELKLR